MSVGVSHMRVGGDARQASPWRFAALCGAVSSLGIALSLGGCAAVGPDFKKPIAALPAKWSAEGDPRIASQAAPDIAWWKTFKDPALDRLVELAHQQNLSLQIAGLRIMEARARLGAATGWQYPQLQQLSGGVSVLRLRVPTPAVNGLTAPAGAALGTSFVYYEVGFDAFWELDFWGKYRRGVQAEAATLMASTADYANALVSLTAEVARTYAAIRTYEVLIALARENEKVQLEGLQIAESRFRNGATSELDVTEATALLESTRASIPQLQIDLQQARNALSTLLGQPPGMLDELLAGPAQIPQAPATVAVGVPAELLRRRPDIRAAELAAAAQCARIGIAKADLYPSLALFGTIGLQTTTGTGLSFDIGNSFFYGFTPRVRWPFFTWGRGRNSVRIQDARFQQALLDYQNTVLKAAQEVEDGLAGILNAQRASSHWEGAVRATRRSVELAVVEYRDGAVDFQRVLEAQRSLLLQQNSLAQARSSVAVSLIALYKALGGGWEAREGQPVVAKPTLDEMKERTHWGDLLEQPSASETNQSPANH